MLDGVPKLARTTQYTAFRQSTFDFLTIFDINIIYLESRFHFICHCIQFSTLKYYCCRAIIDGGSMHHHAGGVTLYELKYFNV